VRKGMFRPQGDEGVGTEGDCILRSKILYPSEVDMNIGISGNKSTFVHVAQKSTKVMHKKFGLHTLGEGSTHKMYS
jgi:hypothetical protein